VVGIGRIYTPVRNLSRYYARLSKAKSASAQVNFFSRSYNGSGSSQRSVVSLHSDDAPPQKSVTDSLKTRPKGFATLRFPFGIYSSFAINLSHEGN
jgi:hypothetical protein